MEQGDSSREVPPVGLEIMEQEQQDTATEALIPPIDHSRKRRRPNADGPKKKSSCWDHFIELTDVVERTAACKHCHKRYRCDPKSHGTSNMLAHSKICYKNPYLENDLKQTNLAFGSGGLISVSPKFDKEACRKAITLFVILDEHPFRVVDGEGFIFLCNQLEPLLTIIDGEGFIFLYSSHFLRADAFKQHLKDKDTIDKKNELERYLNDPCTNDNDKSSLLTWWKQNKPRYPILAAMVKEILATPVSTVASESAFSTGGRVLECYRSSLSPAVAEGLICTQNWLKPARTYFKDINYIEEFGITEEIISEFQQCFITANIGAAGAGAAVGGATGAAVGSTQTQPIGCD